MTHNTISDQTHITFIGGGNMAQAIISGLQAHAFNMQRILVVEPDADKRAQLEKCFSVQTLATIQSDEKQYTNVIILAVKPQQLQAVCATLLPTLSTALIISIAAGISAPRLSSWLKQYPHIVRVMPNTPAQIQAGISALFALPSVSDAYRTLAETIMQAVGETIWLDLEIKMDAVTAISGSGPAYVFYLIEALTLAGERLGLTAAEAKQLALATFSGASQLAAQSSVDISTLRAQVTSKGGTTEQGVAALEKANITEIMYEVVLAAAEKSAALGRAI